jgi:hypothetical protein
MQALYSLGPFANSGGPPCTISCLIPVQVSRDGATRTDLLSWVVPCVVSF